MVAAYHPLPKNPWPAVDRCARREPWESLGGPLEWLGRLQFVPRWLEGDNRILEPAIEPPTAVFDACGRHVPWAARLTLCRTRTRSRPLFRRRTRHWVGSRIVRRSWSTPFSRAPRRSVRQSAWSAPARSRARRARAVLADPKAMWWRPRVTGSTRRPRRGAEPSVRNIERLQWLRSV